MAGMKALACLSLLALTGCCHTQRFVPLGEVGAFALDTKTGQRCYTLSKEQLKGQGLEASPSAQISLKLNFRAAG